MWKEGEGEQRKRNGGWFHSGFIRGTLHFIIKQGSWHLPPSLSISLSPSQLKTWLTSGLSTDCYLSIHPSSDRLPTSFSPSLSLSRPAANQRFLLIYRLPSARADTPRSASALLRCIDFSPEFSSVPWFLSSAFLLFPPDHRRPESSSPPEISSFLHFHS